MIQAGADIQPSDPNTAIQKMTVEQAMAPEWVRERDALIGTLNYVRKKAETLDAAGLLPDTVRVGGNKETGKAWIILGYPPDDVNEAVARWHERYSQLGQTNQDPGGWMMISFEDLEAIAQDPNHPNGKPYITVDLANTDNAGDVWHDRDYFLNNGFVECDFMINGFRYEHEPGTAQTEYSQPTKAVSVVMTPPEVPRKASINDLSATREELQTYIDYCGLGD